VGNVYTSFDFLYVFFCFQVTSPYGTDGQRGRQTDGRAIRVMRPIGRPHNKRILALCYVAFDISNDVMLFSLGLNAKFFTFALTLELKLRDIILPKMSNRRLGSRAHDIGQRL